MFHFISMSWIPDFCHFWINQIAIFRIEPILRTFHLDSVPNGKWFCPVCGDYSMAKYILSTSTSATTMASNTTVWLLLWLLMLSLQVMVTRHRSTVWNFKNFSIKQVLWEWEIIFGNTVWKFINFSATHILRVINCCFWA